MKVHVVYDAQGAIISMGVPGPLGPDLRGPVFGAQAITGQHVAELEVPAEQSHLTLLDLPDSERRLYETNEETSTPFRDGISN
jgi:hypothetical protein